MTHTGLTYGTPTELDIPYRNGTIIKMSVRGGDVEWTKHHREIEEIHDLQCLQGSNEGPIGCAAYVGQIHTFKLNKRGRANWHKVIQGSSTEQCDGIIREEKYFYMLMLTSSDIYTKDGEYRDPVILKFKSSSGAMVSGVTFKFESDVTLGRNMLRMNDGGFIFAGATAGALDYDFGYKAAFLMKFDYDSGDFTCMEMDEIKKKYAMLGSPEERNMEDPTNDITITEEDFL